MKQIWGGGGYEQSRAFRSVDGRAGLCMVLWLWPVGSEIFLASGSIMPILHGALVNEMGPAVRQCLRMGDGLGSWRSVGLYHFCVGQLHPGGCAIKHLLETLKGLTRLHLH
jgi:hypothetical protein